MTSPQVAGSKQPLKLAAPKRTINDGLVNKVSTVQLAAPASNNAEGGTNSPTKQFKPPANMASPPPKWYSKVDEMAKQQSEASAGKTEAKLAPVPTKQVQVDTDDTSAQKEHLLAISWQLPKTKFEPEKLGGNTTSSSSSSAYLLTESSDQESATPMSEEELTKEEVDSFLEDMQASLQFNLQRKFEKKRKLNANASNPLKKGRVEMYASSIQIFKL